MLFVFDTETTGLFPVRTESSNGKDGKTYMNSVKGTGTGIPKNKTYPPDLELLQIGWSIVDPTTFETVASYSTLVQPFTRPNNIYDMVLYAEAVTKGIPLQEAMQTLLSTLQHWDATHDLLVCAHNVAFDRKVVAMSLYRAGFNPDLVWLAHSFHCTMVSVLDLDVRKEYHTWAQAHFPHHYLSRKSLETVLNHRGVPYASTDVAKELKKRVGALRPGEFETCSCAFDWKGFTWPPNLQYLFVYLTQRDIVQTHRADDDVSMLVACIPELIRRGWFVLPQTSQALAPAPAPAPALPIPNERKKTPLKKSSGPLKVSRSTASKRTSVATPTRHYFLRSRGPAPVLCL
jgi:DNA polymerase III epsilon subunit-like protein